ncbi:hypothetical protein EXIGLDRAFT_745299 [Exidia glandulosa HHB12029]|uniref:DUF6533 domain-containing protein n=1 Tax=Exidia glandulosa HHB12029 TaxID=1314781 RepID=A0A165NRB6_EXIGL|nr:hypothetical protein EXIGLDRAFT_745299 [Exidia glandulosa HHB12029]
MHDVEEYRDITAVTFKYYFAAALCLVYYDWLLTFDDEVDRIWAVTWNLFTVLWVGVRYLIMIALLVTATALYDDWGATVCDRFAVLPTVFLFSGLFLSQAVFLIRTWALYGRSRRILLALCSIMVFEIGFLAWGVAYETFYVSPIRRIVGCFPASPKPSAGIAMWSLPFAFDIIVVVLTIRKSFEHWTETQLPMIQVFIRDGIMYFVVIFLSYLVNIIFFVALPSDMHNLNAPMSGVITMLVTCRLILNLRATAIRPGHETESTLVEPPASRMTGLRSILYEFEMDGRRIEWEYDAYRINRY